MDIRNWTYKLYLVGLFSLIIIHCMSCQTTFNSVATKDLNAIGDSIKYNHIIGRYSAGTGTAQQIKLSTDFTFSGDSLKVVGGGGGSPVIISPSTIASDQDDYNPTGFGDATIIRIAGDDGIRAITSMASQSNGEQKTFINIGDYPIYFPGEHPDGTSSNRIITDRDVFLFPKQTLDFWYDATSSRWRPSITINRDEALTGHYFDAAFGSSSSGDWSSMSFSGISGGSISTLSSTSTYPSGVIISSLTSSTAGGMIFPKNVTTSAFASAHMFAEFLVSIPILSNGTETFSSEVQICSNTNSSSLEQNNSINIRYSDAINSGKWEGFSQDNSGSESTVDLGITVAAATLYKLRIEIDKAKSEARFYIDGVFKGRVTGNMPNSNAAGARAIHIKSAGTSGRTFQIHRILHGTIYP